MTDPRAPIFDLCGPLPGGMTVLEASAGTGKTFTIAALAARYVAAGIPIEHLLIVTFTRMATGELRERVRERLVSAEAGLRLAIDGVAPDPADGVLHLLATGRPDELEERRRRLAAALADFDAATIATTHGFCQHILTGLGVAGDVEADVVFVEEPGDLVTEVVDDLYVRHVLHRGYPGFERKDAGEVAARVMANPVATLQPQHAPPGSMYRLRLKLAEGVREQVETRKLRAGLLTYDDLLTRLRGTLLDPDRGPAACHRLRERYRVVLVDEFQDTDPVQWEILHTAFGTGESTLVLIGDPKQAIYSFRGADVFAYLDAARTAAATATLGTNWRSDQALIEACGTLFGQAHLGHPDIAFRAVEAVPSHRRPGLVGAPEGAALRIRVVHRADGAVALSNKDYVTKGSGEAHVAADLAADLVGLLDARSELVTYDDGGAPTGRRPVRPGHVAVLVRTNHQAALVRDALEAAGVPAVINGAGSVFATPVARHWLHLVEALERPASATRARAVALSPFVGWNAATVAGAGDADLAALQADLFGWAAVLERRGVASLLELITRSTGLAARMLARDAGERALTDLRHVGQLLHAEAIATGMGVTALATWLRRRIAEAERETAAEERSRRLESDAEAVQVLTIHRSKGLEFPVVYAPYLWSDPAPDDEYPVYHDPRTGERTVDVGGKGGPDQEPHKRLRRDEERGEDLRLAYVALTRARHQVVLWWAATWGSRASALGRLLFGIRPDGEVEAEIRPVPSDLEALTTLEALAARSGGTMTVERAGGRGTGRWGAAGGGRRDLQVRGFDRRLDDEWRRTSYTAITAGAHAAGPVVGSEAERTEVADELPVPPTPASEAAPGPDDRLLAVASPWAALPGGARTGTLVHAVLETTDFAAPDLGVELAARVGDQVARRAPGFGDPEGLAAALHATLASPLGPVLDGLALRDVGRRDRLDELTFELPLAGGDGAAASGDGRRELPVHALAEALGRHVPAGDPLDGYAHRLADPALDQQLRGYLTGSIDLVVRLPGPRFAVIDYKTNWLGGPGEALSAWHYRPAALGEAMQHAHYPLQALLYSVALHRYLRWRLPGYEPARHLAGTAYLFVRGMTGAATPHVDGQPCGVFPWRPPAALITEVSDLLDRGGR